jgi:hypothetical protein
VKEFLRECKRRGIEIKSAKGCGIGVVLGELSDGRYLVGIDLDSCRDSKSGRIADWAQEVIERFDTYGEISPSGTGVKLFFLMNADDMAELRELLGCNEKGEQLTRKTFSAGKHREVAIDTARFYAVTNQHLKGSPKNFRLVPFSDAEWFIKQAGPHYLALPQTTQKAMSNEARRSLNKGTRPARVLNRENRRLQGKSQGMGQPNRKPTGNGHAKNAYEALDDEQQHERDESGSGYGFRFMRDCHVKGMTEEASARGDSSRRE